MKTKEEEANRTNIKRIKKIKYNGASSRIKMRNKQEKTPKEEKPTQIIHSYCLSSERRGVEATRGAPKKKTQKTLPKLTMLRCERIKPSERIKPKKKNIAL